jgi:hypothetical protein
MNIGFVEALDFMDVPGGFAPATMAAPIEDISGKCSSHITVAEVCFRNSIKPEHQKFPSLC